MPATYEPIATQTLGSTTASVTFSAIPSTYTDLVLVVEFAANAGGVNNGITCNSDTANNYSEVDLGGNGTTITSGKSNSLNYIRSGYVDTTSERCLSVINFMNYANSNVFKSILMHWNSDSYVFTRIATWRSNSAITSITNTAIGSTFVAGSIFTLYGIKAA